MGALVFRHDHGLFTNRVLKLRDQNNWRAEAHFTEINRTTAHLYRAAIDILAATDARFVCGVVDRQKWDPGKSQREYWRTHAQLTIQILNAVLGKGLPVLSVVLDHVTTPEEVNYEGYIATSLNRQRDALVVAGVNRMDSRACLGLQMADVLTGAVGHHYRQLGDKTAKPGSLKGQVAQHVAAQFGLPSLVQASCERFEVVEFERKQQRQGVVRPLRAVPADQAKRPIRRARG